MVSRRAGWAAAALVGLVAGGVLVKHSFDEYERYPPSMGDKAVADRLRCPPMTTEPRITRAIDPSGKPVDAEMIVVDVAGAVVDESRYGFRYTSADGADTQHQRDELLGRGIRKVQYSDEDGVHDLGFIPTVEVPGYREMVVSRSVTIPDWENDYADTWDAICGTVGFTVGTDGSLSDAHLVENPDTGTFEHTGQLR